MAFIFLLLLVLFNHVLTLTVPKNINSCIIKYYDEKYEILIIPNS